MSQLPLAAFSPLLREDVDHLLPPPEREAIDALLAILPAATVGGFECPLGSATSGAAVALRLTADELVDVSLAADIADVVAPLRGVADELWLEFDAEPPALSVFAALDPPLGLPATARGPDPRLDRTFEHVRKLASLLGANADPSLVRAALDSMPASSRLAFVGVMRGRDSGLRLTLARIPTRGATAYVERVEPGRAAGLLETLRMIEPYARHVSLHLDIGDAIGPRIGLELRPDEPSAWSLLLDALANAGLCTIAQATQILAWPARLHSAAGESWPTELRDEDIELVRLINHVKVVHHETDRLETKAYLAYAYGPCFPSPAVWNAQ